MKDAPRDLSLYLFFEMYPPIAVRVWRTHASEVPYCLLTPYLEHLSPMLPKWAA